jgi:ribosomal protein L32E
VRFARKEGVMEVLIHNEKELRAIQKDAKMVAVFAHDLSERKRVELQRIANTNGIRVINGVRA